MREIGEGRKTRREEEGKWEGCAEWRKGKSGEGERGGERDRGSLQGNQGLSRREKGRGSGPQTALIEREVQGRVATVREVLMWRMKVSLGCLCVLDLLWRDGPGKRMLRMALISYIFYSSLFCVDF